ncbi:MAG: hypothetical protein J6S89_11760 [Paludibacteraceae bacterium]|nr:hypothetical protein [Paludibacteraceae bacterium]
MQKANISNSVFTLLTIGALLLLSSCNFIADNNKNSMHLVVEISTPDILKSLAGTHANDDIFTSALGAAKAKQENDHSADIIDLLYEEFKANGYPLNRVFSSPDQKGEINNSTSDNDVVIILKDEVKSATNNTIEVFRSRLKDIEISQIDIRAIDDSKGLISIYLKGVESPESVRKQILGHANLEFWESAELSEIISNVSAVNDMARELEEAQPSVQEKAKVEEPKEEDEWTRELDSIYKNETSYEEEVEFQKKNPLFTMLLISVNMDGTPIPGSTIGHAKAKDTAKISEYFNLAKEKKIFPSNIFLSWKLYTPYYSYEEEEDEETFELIALKSNGEEKKAVLSGNIITSAKTRSDNNYNYVSLEMTPEAGVAWEKITGDNVGRQIAVVLNGRVYCVPRVNCAISCGKCEISGKFSREEAKEIAALLNSGNLNINVKIVEEEFTETTNVSQ